MPLPGQEGRDADASRHSVSTLSGNNDAEYLPTAVNPAFAAP
jgi:hypothetical protein